MLSSTYSDGIYQRRALYIPVPCLRMPAWMDDGIIGVLPESLAAELAKGPEGLVALAWH